jgi:hypothetical protein
MWTFPAILSPITEKVVSIIATKFPWVKMRAPAIIPTRSDEITSLVTRARIIAMRGGRIDNHPKFIEYTSCVTF